MSEDPVSPVAARLALFYAARVLDAARVADFAPDSLKVGRTTAPEDSPLAKNSSQPAVRTASADPAARTHIAGAISRNARTTRHLSPRAREFALRTCLRDICEAV